VDLLDIVLPDQPKRNQAALQGIEGAFQAAAGRVHDGIGEIVGSRPGTSRTIWGRVANCEWIIEAVAENLQIKRDLWYRVAGFRQPGSILSTNTSGIPLASDRGQVR